MVCENSRDDSERDVFSIKTPPIDTSELSSTRSIFNQDPELLTGLWGKKLVHYLATNLHDLGITPEQYENLYKRFSQGDKKYRPNDENYGRKSEENPIKARLSNSIDDILSEVH